MESAERGSTMDSTFVKVFAERPLHGNVRFRGADDLDMLTCQQASQRR